MARSFSPGALFRDQRSIAFLFFVVLIVLYLFSSKLIARSPHIEAITPEVGEPGKVLVISGENFGSERDGSEVIFAGMRPHSGAYLEWSDERISVRIPEEVNSGRLYVRRGNERSNGILFTNLNHIPKRLSGPAAPGLPYIDSIEPAGAAIGSEIRLVGLNFGDEQGSGRVYFATTVDEGEGGATVVVDGVPCSAVDFDYDSWSDQEVTIRVPDGATSGGLRIVSDRGVSNAVYFEVTGMPGDRILTDERGYQISYGVEVENVDASPGNALNLWIPNVLATSAQRNLEAVRDPEPLWEDFNGVARYRLQEVEPWRRYTISVTYWLDRSALETRISAAKVDGDYDRERKLYKVYTSPDSLIRSSSDGVVALARRGVGRESNPYLKARLLYTMLLRDFAPLADGSATVDEFIDRRQGDAWDYARLYAGMLRAVQVPARIVAGSYLFDDGRSAFHYWVEFYIPAFGWVPADPYLGDSGHPAAGEVESPVDYYFGSVDNRRIAFSRGIVDIRPTDPKSLTVALQRVYSLQTVHEEAVGNIEGYESRWQPVKVIDRW